jgi:ribosomal-protein-alanine N-acetyltransferase
LQRGRTIRAVLLSTLYRRPVAAERILALRDSADMQPMFDLLLPYAEARLADRGAHWMSFTNGAAWLADGLVAHGYELQDRVIVYRKEDWAMARRGNPDVRVRRPTLEVLLSIVALDADAFEPFWRLNQTILKQAICDSAYYLVAELGQKIVGYLLAEKHGDEALIGRVGVAPAFQRQGIATRLMAEALALMQRDGLKAVLLNTQEDNLPSRTLYEGLGFRLTGEADTIWAKQLTSTSGAKR